MLGLGLSSFPETEHKPKKTLQPQLNARWEGQPAPDCRRELAAGHLPLARAGPPVRLRGCCRASNHAYWLLFLFVRKVTVPLALHPRVAPWVVPWLERLGQRSMASVTALPWGSDGPVRLRWGCPIPGSAQAVTENNDFFRSCAFFCGKQVLRDLPRSPMVP